MTDHRESCDRCPLVERRDFLREAGVAAAAICAALGIPVRGAQALAIRFGGPRSSRDEEHAYPIPATDGATIDRENQVIVVRYAQKAYAFNLSCPHQNTALHWQPEDNQFQCPKHHSRYRPDGVFISGRATRGMDRFGVRRDGETMVVDVDQYYRQDRNPAEWAAAFLDL